MFIFLPSEASEEVKTFVFCISEGSGGFPTVIFRVSEGSDGMKTVVFCIWVSRWVVKPAHTEINFPD
jgi:hypothetical protein